MESRCSYFAFLVLSVFISASIVEAEKASSNVTIECSNENNRTYICKNLSEEDVKKVKLLDVDRYVLKKESSKKLTLPVNMFPTNLSSFTALTLSDIGLENIEGGAFEVFRNLTELDLSKNHLEDIHNGTFKGLTNLTKLYLNGNNITTIESKVFEDVRQLSHLNLTQNSLKSIGIEMLPLTNLKVLELQENKLECLNPHVFDGLLTDLEVCYGGNPWNETCNTQLRDYSKRGNENTGGYCVNHVIFISLAKQTRKKREETVNSTTEQTTEKRQEIVNLTTEVPTKQTTEQRQEIVNLTTEVPTEQTTEQQQKEVSHAGNSSLEPEHVTLPGTSNNSSRQSFQTVCLFTIFLGLLMF